MNELKIFEQREVLGKEFRIYGDVKNPLFLAKDVAEWIDYGVSNVKMVKNVDEDEKIITRTNNTSATFLTEDGLYEVLMQSRKPIAKQFKKQVKIILKQIREIGGYIPVSQDESDEEFLAKALLVAQRTLERKNKLLQEKEEIIQLQKPKVEIYDMFMDKDGTYGFRELRKSLESGLNISIKENDLKEIMYELGWISNPRSVKKLLAKCIREGYGTTKDVIDRFGNPITVDRFTMKGREKILKYFQN